MKLSPQQRILGTFLGGLAVLIAIGGLSLWSLDHARETVRQLDRSRTVYALIEKTISSLVDMETAQRGFVILGKSEYLGPYEPARKRVQNNLRSLAAMRGENQNRDMALDRLVPMVHQRMQRMDKLLELRKEHGFLQFEDMNALDEGRVLMDSIRVLIHEMEDNEIALLETRNQAAQNVFNFTRIIVSAFMVGAVLLVAAASWIVARDLKKQQITEQALRASEMAMRKHSEEIYDLYNHAPCGYHSLDSSGLIMNINDTELSWLGYTRDEVIGIMRFHDFLKEEGLAVFGANFPKFKRDGRISNLEFEIRRKDGTFLPVMLNATAIMDPSGQFVASRTTLFDLTEKRKSDARIGKLLADLETHAARLEGANKDLEAFSYSVSHDLRAPLRHINGFCDLLRRSSADVLNEKATRYLNLIAKSSKQMGMLIDDLLEFSRNGRSPLHMSRVNLNAVVQDVKTQTAPDCEGRKIEWGIQDLPAVVADPALLRQVMLNLICNAIKYTRTQETARIEIGASRNGSGCTTIFVRDNGVGFDMDYVGKLFGVFQRLHSAEDFEGTGVGLANVKQIITRHNGEVWAESIPGKGACFSFSLPDLAPKTNTI